MYVLVERANKLPKIREMINDLTDKMWKAGYYMNDIHAGNFGFKNKMLVCIDFGG